MGMKQLPLLESPAELETPIMRDILVAATALPGVHLWRHNTGLARTIDGRYIRFGLIGSADIIGAVRGHPVAIETKRTVGGRHAKKQQDFAEAWTKAGGVYILARSVDDALSALAAL